MDDLTLRNGMASALAAQLGDADLAGRLAATVLDVGASWVPPMIAAREVDSIVAYAFGNRPRPGPAPAPGAALAERLDLPGPVNAQLADTIIALRRIRPVPVYAQWEIARILRETHGLEEVFSVEPVVGPTGEIVYLSTDGVAAAIVEHAGPALGTVAVVAHRDHAKRCVQVSRGAGMTAYVASDVDLPADYDPASGQAWTRRREVYLVHDMIAQLMAHRARAIADT